MPSKSTGLSQREEGWKSGPWSGCRRRQCRDALGGLGPQTPEQWASVWPCVGRGVEARAGQVPLHKAWREAVDSSVLTQG